MVNNRGGQPGNKNAVKHSVYVKRYDGRTTLGKTLRGIESTLASALGDPSPQKILILQRVAVKAVRCAAIENELLRKKRTAPTLENHYLRWARELREDLKTLGLERRAKDVIDAKGWAEKKYGNGS
jgi:hypothetical protein